MKFKKMLAVFALAVMLAAFGAFAACSAPAEEDAPQSGNEQTTPETPGGDQGDGEQGGQTTPDEGQGEETPEEPQEPEEPEEPEGTGEILIVYFSATGNTEEVAQLMQTYLNADLVEIVPEVPYTSADLNYGNSDSRTSVENRDENSRPGIANAIENMADYDTVLVGYPIWHGIVPRIIQTFFESYDFSGKDVYTFSTSASSSGSGAFNALARMYTDINFVENLHLTSSQLSSASTRVESWLSAAGLI